MHALWHWLLTIYLWGGFVSFALVFAFFIIDLAIGYKKTIKHNQHFEPFFAMIVYLPDNTVLATIDYFVLGILGAIGMGIFFGVLWPIILYCVAELFVDAKMHPIQGC